MTEHTHAPPTMSGSIEVAIEVFEFTVGDERTRLLAALEAFTIALRGAEMLKSAKPTSPFTNGEDAARYLADTAAHPRYAGDDGWRSLLAPGHDLTMVQAAIRVRPSLPADTPAMMRFAVEAVEAAQAVGEPSTRGR